MAALDEFIENETIIESSKPLKAADLIKDAFKKELAKFFWIWFEANKNKKVYTVSIWFVKKTIYVHHLEELFEMMFGQRPHGLLA